MKEDKERRSPRNLRELFIFGGRAEKNRPVKEGKEEQTE